MSGVNQVFGELEAKRDQRELERTIAELEERLELSRYAVDTERKRGDELVKKVMDHERTIARLEATLASVTSERDHLLEHDRGVGTIAEVAR